MHTRSRGRQGRRSKVDYDDIVETSLGIIDTEGLEALTMRRLGRDLSVDPMAVYHHISGKPELLDALVDRVMSEVDVAADDPAQPWQDRVRRMAYAYRDVLKAHPHMLPVIADGRARMFGGLAPADTLLSIFAAADLPRSKWLIAMSAFSSWVLGSTLSETTSGEGASDVIIDWAANAPAEHYPYVAVAIATHTQTEPDAYFRYGVISLIGALNAIASGNGNGRPKEAAGS